MTRSKKTAKKTSTSDAANVGETLVRNYGARLDVRQQRDAFAPRENAARLRTLYGFAPRENAAGRQTTPELASIASEYMDHEDPNVRSLAASVLGQVNEK